MVNQQVPVTFLGRIHMGSGASSSRGRRPWPEAGRPDVEIHPQGPQGMRRFSRKVRSSWHASLVLFGFLLCSTKQKGRETQTTQRKRNLLSVLLCSLPPFFQPLKAKRSRPEVWELRGAQAFEQRPFSWRRDGWGYHLSCFCGGQQKKFSPGEDSYPRETIILRGTLTTRPIPRSTSSLKRFPR